MYHHYDAFDGDGMPERLPATVRFDNWTGADLTSETSGLVAFSIFVQRAKALRAERTRRITSILQTADAVVVRIADPGSLRSIFRTVHAQEL